MVQNNNNNEFNQRLIDFAIHGLVAVGAGVIISGIIGSFIHEGNLHPYSMNQWSGKRYIVLYRIRNLMNSKIQTIIPYYTKFENILPDELIHQITEELAGAKNEINKIIDEDLKKIKNLASSQNKAIAVNEFLKPSFIIRNAFYIENDHPLQDQASYYYAHWMMSLSTLQSLAQNVIEISRELRTSYASYMSGSTQEEKRTAFNHFVRTYQDFCGYLISIRNTITQYYDLFVQTCNEIDPNNKAKTLIAYRSDIGHLELLAATKELLLHGNMGRLAGFALLRSAVEVFITRELFNIKKSQKYSNYHIIFPGKNIPSLNTISSRIEKLHLDRYFKTDSLKRLYTWQSIVAHRGYHAEEYLIWFVYYHTAIEIIGAFNANLISRSNT